MKITRVGLDIAEQVFQVHGVDARGEARVSKQLARTQVLKSFAQLQTGKMLRAVLALPARYVPFLPLPRATSLRP
jgi:transposase